MAILTDTINYTGTSSYVALSGVTGVTNYYSAKSLHLSIVGAGGEYVVATSTPTVGHPMADGETIEFGLSGIEDLQEWLAIFKLKSTGGGVFVISIWR